MIHLRTHSHYSIKKAFGDEKSLIKKAKELGMTHLALTDYAADFGFPYFWKEAKDKGIHPLFGVEFYVTNDMTRKGKPSYEDMHNENDTIIFMAKNNDGYKELLRILSEANLQQHYFVVPRIDYEYISEINTENLVCIIPHMTSSISKYLMNQNDRAARRLIRLLKGMFDEDVYFEISSNVSNLNATLNKKIVEAANKAKIKMVASSNIHYPNKEDKELHDILLAVGQKATFAENNLWTLGSSDNFMKSEDEVIDGLSKNGIEDDLIKELIDNTHEIKNKCEFDLEFPELTIPNPPLPEGFNNNEEYFNYLIEDGWKKKIEPRINSGEWDEIKEEQIEIYRDRIKYEFDMIKNVFYYKDPNTKNKEGFIPYILLVADYTRWAKGIDRRIMEDWPIVEVGPGRGSIGGSLIGYLVDLTTVDAIQYGLTFERFINPERVNWPDIDLDFDPDNAWCVEKYLEATYGYDKVAHILTFQTLAPKKAFEYITKTLSGNYGKFKVKTKKEFWKSEEELKKLLMLDSKKAREIQDKIDSNESIESHIKEDGTLYEEYKIPTYKKIIDLMIRMQGTITSTGSHPGAVIIADIPLWNHTSRVNNGKYPDNSIMMTTSYEKYALEDVNTMKYDILRLRELSIVKNTKEFIEQSTGQSIDLAKINRYDVESNLKILELLKSQDLDGIFQISSALFRGLIEKVLEGIEERGDEVVAKDLFDIIVALEALGRPGPLNSGMDDTFASGLANPEGVEKIHPVVDEILKETYGNMLYQEQIMFILQQLGGFSLGQADMVRRGIASGKSELIEKQRQPFLDGVQNVHKEKSPSADEVELDELNTLANKIFDWMVKFAEYGFNKAHSVEYGIITHQGLWLKANYKPQFMASLMSAKSKDQDKLVKYIDEIRSRGIKVMPPKINHSKAGFTVVGDNILFGLAAINGVGVTAVENIIENYPFSNILDFMQRTNSRSCGKRVIPNLIKAGAFEENKRFLLKYWQVLYEIKKGETKKEESIIDYIEENGINEKTYKTLSLKLDDIIEDKVSKKRTEKTKNECLALIDHNQYDDFTLLAMEKEVLGLYLSSNPMTEYEDIIYAGTVLQKDLKRYTMKDELFICGMILETPPVRLDKNKNEMCFLKIQMYDAMQDCVVFHGPYGKVKNKLIEGNIVIIKGKKGRGGGFVVEKVSNLRKSAKIWREFFNIKEPK